MKNICTRTVSNALSDIKSDVNYLKQKVNDEDYDIDLINSAISDVENSINIATYIFDNYSSEVDDIASSLEDLYNTSTNLNR